MDNQLNGAIDIGVNMCSKQFRNQKEILDRAEKSGVNKIITISNSFKECKSNLSLIRRFRDHKIYCTIGVHPHNAKELDDTKLKSIRELIVKNRKSVVAIGECGLDFNRNFSPPDVQKKWFEEQIKLSIDLDIPLYFHERDAFDDFVEIVSKYELAGKGVIHCFTGTKKALETYLKLGFYIGITGWVCDERRGKELQKIIPLIPDDKLLIETDAPWLNPVPRNIKGRPRWSEPSHLYYVVKKVAELRGTTVEELVVLTTDNAKTVFSL